MLDRRKIIHSFFFASVAAFFFLAAPIVSAQDAEELFHIPGTVEGSGKHFAITDSEYLNISLDSSENIEVRIESAPEMIVINTKASGEFSSADITISGLSSNTTYHKYQDDYHNYAPLVSDENGKSSFYQDLSQDHIIFIQPRKSTMFIKDDATGGDCQSIGSWDASSKTCTLSKDVSETIQIDNDNITLDGGGYKISGNNRSGFGIYAYRKRGITVRNVAVSNFSYGVHFYLCENGKVTNSRLENNASGIRLNSSKSLIISNNFLEFNSYGIYQISGNQTTYENNNVLQSTFSGLITNSSSNSILRNNTVKLGLSRGIFLNGDYNTLSGNIMFGNKKGNFSVNGNDMSTNDIDTSNTVEGKPIYYIKDAINKTYDDSMDIGSFYCVNCENIRIQRLTLPENFSEISFWHTDNSSIERITSLDKSGLIKLCYSTSNTIFESTFGQIYFYYQSNNNRIFNNNLMDRHSPVDLYDSSGNIFNLDLPVGGNYWKHYTSCRDNDNSGICDYSYRLITGVTDNYPWAKPFNFDYSPAPPLPSGNSNVMFLPGIKASKLYKDGILGTEDQLWPPNYFGNDLEELALNENGESVNNVYTRDIIEELGIFGIGDIYKTFREKLDSLKLNGTINDYDLFAYDWRQSVEDVAQNGTPYPSGIIKSAVAELGTLAESSQNKKVTIVAHSMGGLLAKAIMQELEKTGQADKVDKIVFVDVPQTGTPIAVLSMLYGYDEAVLFGTLISQADARKLAENMPSVYGLLPSEKYFEQTEEPFITFSSEQTRYKDFKDAYGGSVDSFEEFRKFLTGEGDGREKPDKNKVDLENVLRGNLFDEAAETHERLDNWTPPENVQVIEIAGWGLDTVSGVDYTEKENIKCYAYPGFKVPSCAGAGEYKPVYEPKFTVDGDKVVVTPSALMLAESENVKRYWVDLYRSNKTFTSGRKHGNILEFPYLQEFLQKIISSEEISSSLPEYIYSNRPEDYNNAKPRIRMSLYSPLDIHLYDDAGHHTGPKIIIDDSGNQQTIFEEGIPDSYYYQFGDQKYVGVPSGENIHMTMDGYDSGAFTLKMEEVKTTASGEETTSHTTFKNLPVSSDTNVSLDIPQSGLDNLASLKTDFDGDGENDYEITPVSNGEAVLPDIIPPETKVELSGTPGNNDWYVSDVSVTLSVADNEGGTGVDAISYSLDGGASWQDYSEPVNISEEKITDLQYFSTDKIGNKEAAKAGTIKIDKTAPEAKIIFNQADRKLDIIGVDNLSSNVSVTEEKQTVDQKAKTKKGIFSWFLNIIKKGKNNKDIVATLSDEAGHKTEIVYQKNKDKDRRVDISPQSVSYDGAKIAFPKSLLQYKWLFNLKKQKYLLFGSHIKTDAETLEAHYLPKKNETWIMKKPQELDDDDNDDDAERRPVWKKLSGMVVPYIQTEKGEINVEY